MPTIVHRPSLLHLLLAFASGGLLTVMVDFNALLASHSSAFHSSWVAHATGSVAGLIFLAILRMGASAAAKGGRPPAPLWAYSAGILGGATVMLTSTAANSALALSGTLALGLAGQVLFSLAADRWGLFGLPRRMPRLTDFGALALIAGGSVLIIFGWG
ncbi:DMT family transporter [Pelagibacterium montanilacus]|uniref:DMT family transporter n=1 Tax=Pelagibacterium montanilacus TaxID=2185280 RepID=UPI000F8D23A4|nr:DMT family transporter [Pelagibacterium montanilacus]